MWRHGHTSVGALGVNLRTSPCFCFLSDVMAEAPQASPGTPSLNFQVKIPGCFFEGKMSIRFRVAVWDGAWFSVFNQVPGLREMDATPAQGCR